MAPRGAFRSEDTRVTAVPSSATVVTILAASQARAMASIFNDSSAALTLKMGPAASITDKSVIVGAGGYFEVPIDYTGIITGLWASVNGSAYVTEYI